MFFYCSSKNVCVLTSINPCCYNRILIFSDTNKPSLSRKGLTPMKRKTHKHQMLMSLTVMIIIIIALKTPLIFHIYTLSSLYPESRIFHVLSLPCKKSDHSR